MLAIIAHHSIVNSTVLDSVDFSNPSLNAYFLSVWGMWGKTAINSFILISGWFLCVGDVTWRKILKLLLEVYFYKIVIMLVFALAGYEPLSFKGTLLSLISPVKWVNNGFFASFLAFYLFVPVYNVLIRNLTKRQHLLMLCGLLFYFSIASTFLNARTMNEPFWYMTLYFLAAYLRLYPSKWSQSRKVALASLLSGVAVSVAFCIGVMWVVGHSSLFPIPESLAEKLLGIGVGIDYWLVSDSNKLLALVVGTSAFLVAKNAPTFHSRWINTLSAGTFAVLLIHASSDTMRRWLWQDVLDIPSFMGLPLGEMVLRLAVIPVAVFLCCSLIDIPRRRWLEKPLMNRIRR